MMAPLLLLWLWLSVVCSFIPKTVLVKKTSLLATKAPPEKTTTKDTGNRKKRTSFEDKVARRMVRAEITGDIQGAEAFGGKKEKDDLFDPKLEAKATVFESTKLAYDKYLDRDAFDEAGGRIARSLQEEINRILYVEEALKPRDWPGVQYHPTQFQWTNIFENDSARTPFEALENALKFYNRLDVAIVYAKKTKDNQVFLRWNISVEWPTLWAPKILLPGTSTLQFSSTEEGDFVILSQVDALEVDSDLLSCVASQVAPRFFDIYHLGLTPYAEIMPQSSKEKKLFASYDKVELPPRLVYRPSMLDDDRTGALKNANAVPDFSFATQIRTAGPTRQRFVTSSPVEVQITREKFECNRITWTIPVPVECQTFTSPLPVPDVFAKETEEDWSPPEDMEPAVRYEFQPKRVFATLPYSGFPQDPEIAGVRKNLFQQVTKDGLKPKIGPDGRPVFFMLQHDIKACFVNDGFGMVVYEPRPKIITRNHVAVELEDE